MLHENHDSRGNTSRRTICLNIILQNPPPQKTILRNAFGKKQGWIEMRTMLMVDTSQDEGQLMRNRYNRGGGQEPGKYDWKPQEETPRHHITVGHRNTVSAGQSLCCNMQRPVL